ncbi:hypothetical protein CISIN_1g0394692mg, partial [Citrus sinensis]
GRV